MSRADVGLYLNHHDVEEIARAAVATRAAERMARLYSLPPAGIHQMVRDALYECAANPHRDDLPHSTSPSHDDVEFQNSLRRTFPIKRGGAMKRISHDQVVDRSYPEDRWPLATAAFEARMDFNRWLIQNDLMTIGGPRLDHQIVITADVVDVLAGPMARNLDTHGRTAIETYQYRPWPSAMR